MRKYKSIKAIIIFFMIMMVKCFGLENKIILKIDNEIITTLDIFDEIKSLKYFNKNFNNIVDEDEIYQVALQSIIKHTIKKKEVLKNVDNFEIIDEDLLNSLIKKNYERIGFENSSSFEDNLIKNQISFSKFKEKLQVNLIWNEIIYSRYFDKVVLNEKKLKEQINKRKKFSKTYKLNEIIFQVQNLDEIKSAYNKIKIDIEKLGFEASAIKHSLSNTSSNGGSLGWINENKLNERVLNELENTQLKSITNPIRISGGFLILQKLEEKEVSINFNADEELKILMQFETEQQLNNFSNIYFNKIKNDLKIYAP